MFVLFNPKMDVFLKPGLVQEMKVHPQSKGNTQFYNTKTEETFRFDGFHFQRWLIFYHGHPRNTNQKFFGLKKPKERRLTNPSSRSAPFNRIKRNSLSNVSALRRHSTVETNAKMALFQRKYSM